MVQLAGFSLVQVWPQDHHLNLSSKQTCLSKGDSPKKYIEGDTSLLTTPSNSVLHDQDLLSVIFSYLSFPKRSKLSCVNKDWQCASKNHRAFAICCTDSGMKLKDVLKFVGKRFNNLKKITLNFTPFCTWINGFYVHGPTLKELFEKRATVLRSVAIVIGHQTNEKIMKMYQ